MSARGPRYLAQQKGEKKYLSEGPCKKGHFALRVTATGSCTECIKENERRRYYADPEKTKQVIAKNYHVNAEKLREKRRNAYMENLETERETAKLRSRFWRKNNPNHRNALKAAYKASKIARTPKWADKIAIIKFYKSCPKGFHVDHIYPMRGKYVSGLHVIGNLQYLSAADNMKKNNRYLPA
jgi:hypothetical protein